MRPRSAAPGAGAGSAAPQRRPGTGSGARRPRPPWGAPLASAAASAALPWPEQAVPQRPPRSAVDSASRRRGPSPRVFSSRVADFRPLISEGRNPKRRAGSADSNATPLDPRAVPAWRQRADDFLTAERLERAAAEASLVLGPPSSSEPDKEAAAAADADAGPAASATSAAAPPPSQSGAAALERRMDKRLPLETFDGDESFEALRRGGAAAAVGLGGRVRIRDAGTEEASRCRRALPRYLALPRHFHGTARQ